MLKKRKKLKKQKKMRQGQPETSGIEYFFAYFALNLLSAHKMWGRKINDKKKILWRTSTESSCKDT